jgi:hypothetical protein
MIDKEVQNVLDNNNTNCDVKKQKLLEHFGKYDARACAELFLRYLKNDN